MNPDSPASNDESPRWRLLRDLLKFQAKLFVDGLRDLLMSPISIGAALAGLLLERERPSLYFDRLQDLGRRSERWINLFGRHGSKPAGLSANQQDPSIDELFSHLERRIVEQYERGGAAATAKHAVDRSLDRVHQGLDRLKQRVNEVEREEQA